MNAYLAAGTLIAFLTCGYGQAQESDTSEKVASYITKVKCRECRIDPGMADVGHSTWHVTTSSPAKRLASEHCVLKREEYWVDVESDSPKLEQKDEYNLLWLRKESSCTWDENIASVSVQGYYTEKQAIKMLRLVKNILDQAKSGNCYRHYECEEGVVASLQSVTIDDLAEIGREGDYATYQFLAGAESESRAVKTFNFKLEKRTKVISLETGYFEIN